MRLVTGCLHQAMDGCMVWVVKAMTFTNLSPDKMCPWITVEPTGKMSMQKSEGVFTSHWQSVMFITFILSLLFGLVWFLIFCFAVLLVFFFCFFFVLNSRLKGKKGLRQQGRRKLHQNCTENCHPDNHCSTSANCRGRQLPRGFIVPLFSFMLTPLCVNMSLDTTKDVFSFGVENCFDIQMHCSLHRLSGHLCAVPN